MGVDRKALIRAYKDAPPPAGIFAVRNTVNGMTFLTATMNLPGLRNRMSHDLQEGTHPNQVLQRDYNELGADAFAFEVLDTLEPSDDPAHDAAEELATLEEMWRDRLTAEGVGDYGARARRA
jgi:hypothetical protein